MKMRALFCSLLVVCVAPLLVFRAVADPILPYQEPIEQRLVNEIALGIEPLATLNKALNAYHKPSKSLNGDLSILSNLNILLGEVTGYPPLLAQAANDYMAYLQVQNLQLTAQLIPAPLSSTRQNAANALQKVETSLSKAASATSLSAQISKLATAASQQKTASNQVQQALKQPIGLSSMRAKVGAITFKSSKGYTTGGTNFSSALGTAVGEVSSRENTLTFSAVHNGSIIRGISLHVEGISLQTPAIYPLGVGRNTAFYDVTEASTRQAYHFQGLTTLTNSLVPFAFLSIDYIGSNYLIGSFGFMATNTANYYISNTNSLLTTISQGQFQLNFNN
jgi:hypothetical protein